MQANSVPLAAIKLSCSSRTVRQLIADRKLGFVRVGRRVVITDDQITDFLRKNAVLPVDAESIAVGILRGKHGG